MVPASTYTIVDSKDGQFGRRQPKKDERETIATTFQFLQPGHEHSTCQSSLEREIDVALREIVEMPQHNLPGLYTHRLWIEFGQSPCQRIRIDVMSNAELVVKNLSS